MTAVVTASGLGLYFFHSRRADRDSQKGWGGLRKPGSSSFSNKSLCACRLRLSSSLHPGFLSLLDNNGKCHLPALTVHTRWRDTLRSVPPWRILPGLAVWFHAVTSVPLVPTSGDGACPDSLVADPISMATGAISPRNVSCRNEKSTFAGTLHHCKLVVLSWGQFYSPRDFWQGLNLLLVLCIFITFER